MKLLTNAQQLAVRIHNVASMRYQLDYETRLLSEIQTKELKKKNSFFKKPDHFLLQEYKERLDCFGKMKEMLSAYEDILQEEYNQENKNPKPNESN